MRSGREAIQKKQTQMMFFSEPQSDQKQPF
jgi:hypothetical protein